MGAGLVTSDGLAVLDETSLPSFARLGGWGTRPYVLRLGRLRQGNHVNFQ